MSKPKLEVTPLPLPSPEEAKRPVKVMLTARYTDFDHQYMSEGECRIILADPLKTLEEFMLENPTYKGVGLLGVSCKLAMFTPEQYHLTFGQLPDLVLVIDDPSDRVGPPEL